MLTSTNDNRMVSVVNTPNADGVQTKAACVCLNRLHGANVGHKTDASFRRVKSSQQIFQIGVGNGHAKQYRIDLVQLWMKTASEKMGKYRKKYSFTTDDGQMNAKREPPLVGVIP